MKRAVIICGLSAVVLFIAYQFILRDNRSRLKVEPGKIHSTALSEPVVPVQNTSIERKLLREAFVYFQADDVAATRNSINTLAKQFSAYVSSHKEESYNDNLEYQTVVRVPSGNLDEFTAKLEPLAKKMRSKNLSSHDVTDEYIDIYARLTTKRELEKRYREILRKATKVTEMLEVERQLETVRGEIESMEARIEHINNHVAYSTVTITYYQHVVTADGEPFGQEIANSLGTGWSRMLAFIVAMLSAWPLLIFGSLAVWLSVKAVRKWQLFQPQPVNKS